MHAFFLCNRRLSMIQTSFRVNDFAAANFQSNFGRPLIYIFVLTVKKNTININIIKFMKDSIVDSDFE